MHGINKVEKKRRSREQKKKHLKPILRLHCLTSYSLMSNPMWLPGVAKVLSDFISLFCCLTTRSLDVERNVSTAYCKSSSGDGVDWLWHGIIYHGGLL